MDVYDRVPYVVLPWDDDQSKAVFSVPEDVAASLIARPILCRGGSFELQVDSISQQLALGRREGNFQFLSTVFYSPDPNQTALDISRRLAMRIENTDTFLMDNASSIFGTLLSKPS